MNGVTAKSARTRVSKEGSFGVMFAESTLGPLERIARAVSLARSLAGVPWTPEPPRRATERARWLAMGDPQTSPERMFAFLDREGALGDDGRLREDVGLVSIGDHFDYGRDHSRAAADGLAILRWLAEHAGDHVVILAGNHDLARVMELAWETDASFAQAYALATEHETLRARGEDTSALRARFAASFPHIPTPEIGARDLSGFTESQRALVQSLLLEHRMVLAAVGTLPPDALLVHAGVTTRELALLGLDGGASPRAIVDALDRFLRAAVERVREDWTQGRRAPLDLRPVHVAGTSGVEGGGLLYHRAANPDRDGVADPSWERGGPAPRRHDPRELPGGLVQIVGHTGHKKSRDELRPWLTAHADSVKVGGGLRTLLVGDPPVYDLGVHLPVAGEAALILIDGAMSDAMVDDCALLRLASVAV